MPDDPEPQAVVGGAPTAAGDWPDAAAVYWGDSVSCTGVLVAPNVVLTAGHCAGNLTRVTLGTNDHTSGGETIDVAAFYAYPEFLGTYDVTAIVLAEDAVTPPRPIAMQCVIEDYLYAGAEVAIVGFGATDEWGAVWGTVLQEAYTTVVDPDCTDLDADCNPAVSPGGELIAGGDGVDSCSGDSGGPLYLLTSRGDFVVGLTSRGVLPSATPCGAGGIYVRVDPVVDWIELVTGASLVRPDCEGINRAPSGTAPDIEIVQGIVGGTRIDVADPNLEDHHTFSIDTPPTHGSVAVTERGGVVYTADLGWSGTDRFAGWVEEDGEPALGGRVEIGVTGVRRPQTIVLEPVPGCSVASARPGAAFSLVVAMLVRRRS